LPRALLYNDGGFDVSPDGKTLCACAEYWLPDGIDNAMELVRQEEHLYGSDATEEDRMDVDDDDHHTLEEEMDHKEGFDTRSAVTAALTRLRGIAGETTEHRSRTSSPYNGSQAPALPLTPPASTTHVQMLDYVPQTPPYLTTQGRNANMSPPSPPGRRSQRVFGHHRSHADTNTTDVAVESENRGFSTPPPPPQPPVPPAPPAFRTPHPLCIVSKSGVFPDCKGRYVPHVVTISLDTDPIPEGIDQRGKQYGAVADGYRPRLGQLIEACPLDTNKASAVTCVKFSPSTDFCLIGFGVREPLMDTVGAGGLNNYHPVTSLYRIKGGMTHVSTMLSGDDDVNIARFHPDVGYGFVYGTKQGRVRILSPRPWNYYHC
jgi:activator-of-BECN1-regulated-autophagy protein 1